MEEETKKKSFEENITELEKIVKNLEAGSVPLEQAIELFTEGMQLAKMCGDDLNNATEKVNKILTENGELQEFETPAE